MNTRPTDEERHILVVDDDRRIRSLIQKYLQDNGFRVSTAGDASAARQIVASIDFDLMVLDVMMPGEDGFALTQAIRTGATDARRALPIVLLTARGEVEDRITGLANGADDYLAKPFEPQELLLRLNAILRRAEADAQRQTATAAVAFGNWRFLPTEGRLERDGEEVTLTGNEAALLRALALDPGVAFNRQALLERTGASGADERAIDVQITRLRRKIEDDPRRPRHLLTVRGEGYMLQTD